jgi:Zn-dependent peptidase ImmA (M78 family)
MSIAHEIGHYVLGHELPGEGDERSWFATSCEHRDKRQEREAEVVAVEHLMPELMVKPYCTGTQVDMSAVRAIETRRRWRLRSGWSSCHRRRARSCIPWAVASTG